MGIYSQVVIISLGKTLGNQYLPLRCPYQLYEAYKHIASLNTTFCN